MIYFMLLIIQQYSRLQAWHDQGLNVTGLHFSPPFSSASSAGLCSRQALFTELTMAGSRPGLPIQLKQKRKDFSSQQCALRS